MASLFPLIRFVSGEIITVTLWAAWLLMAWHIWDWSPILPNPNAQEMLWIPHHYLPLPTNGVWVMQGRCAILSMAIDLAIEEENLSFILIISDFILLLKDAWGTNPKIKFLTLVGRGTNRQANTWNGQSEWEQWLNENHWEILTLNPTETTHFVVSFES